MGEEAEITFSKLFAAADPSCANRALAIPRYPTPSVFLTIHLFPASSTIIYYRCIGVVAPRYLTSFLSSASRIGSLLDSMRIHARSFTDACGACFGRKRSGA